MSVPISSTEPRSFLIPASVDRPGDDPIFALNAAAQERARQGEDIVNATLGALMEDDGTLAIMPSVFETLANVPGARAAAYAPIAGDAGFREAVIRDLFGGTPLEQQAVAVATPGGTGAVHHAIVNFLDPGESLLTTSYYWGPYKILATHTGRRVETSEMFRTDGRFDGAAFRTALLRLAGAQERVLVILNTPCHNPTGYSFDESEWGQIADALREASSQASVTLLLDLAYARFGAPDSNMWVRHVESLVDSVLVLCAWTVSKAFAQYGARVGALVAIHPDAQERQRIFNALSYSCRGTWSNCNHLGMLAVTQLLEDPELRRRSDEERSRLTALLGARVELFNREASKAGLSYPRYEGGFFVTVFTPDAEVTARKTQELGVFVVPLQGGVRVALCSTPAAQVPRLVQALVEGVRAARAPREARATDGA